MVDDLQGLPSVGSEHTLQAVYHLPQDPQDPQDSAPQPSLYNTQNADSDSSTRMPSDTGNRLFFPPPSPELSKLMLKRKNLELERQHGQLGEQLTQAITQAASTATPLVKSGRRPGRRPGRRSGQVSQPWWNEQLKELRRDFNRSKRRYFKEGGRCSEADTLLLENDFLNCRRIYFTEIRRAKRDYENRFLEDSFNLISI